MDKGAYQLHALVRFWIEASNSSDNIRREIGEVDGGIDFDDERHCRPTLRSKSSPNEQSLYYSGLKL